MANHKSTDRESGTQLMPKFDAKGLVTAIVSETGSGKPLMVAHMNEAALELSISSGEAHFFSRSRNEIWHKGGTSGNVLRIDDMLVDCDQDAVWLSVTPQGHGAACHTGQKSCFFRRIVTNDGVVTLQPTGEAPLFDPKNVYGS
ncbi:MAG: phosphoribosyl-AMP cyclohydrolase [Rhizobiaceae bacterium]|nr:phosphoribosyl-AMP cyclohydrolase [Rhizobiaceae bacterium]